MRVVTHSTRLNTQVGENAVGDGDIIALRPEWASQYFIVTLTFSTKLERYESIGLKTKLRDYNTGEDTDFCSYRPAPSRNANYLL